MPTDQVSRSRECRPAQEWKPRQRVRSMVRFLTERFFRARIRVTSGSSGPWLMETRSITLEPGRARHLRLAEQDRGHW